MFSQYVHTAQREEGLIEGWSSLPTGRVSRQQQEKVLFWGKLIQFQTKLQASKMGDQVTWVSSGERDACAFLVPFNITITRRCRVVMSEATNLKFGLATGVNILVFRLKWLIVFVSGCFHQEHHQRPLDITSEADFPKQTWASTGNLILWLQSVCLS